MSHKYSFEKVHGKCGHYYLQSNFLFLFFLKKLQNLKRVVLTTIINESQDCEASTNDDVRISLPE